MVIDEYIGVAEMIPFQPSATGKVNLISGDDLLPQSMKSILSTPKGSRFMNGWYGSDLYLLNFEQNNAVLFTLAKSYSIDALQLCEPRAQYKQDESYVERIDENAINIVIKYQKYSMNVIDTFVYPFYYKITR